MKWFYSGSNLISLGKLDRLVNDVLLVDDFDSKDFTGFHVAQEAQCLDNFTSDPHSQFSAEDG